MNREGPRRFEFPPGLTHLNFILLIQDIMIHAFEIRDGGKAALLLTKPAASGDACA
jgi:hypothetical protein